MYQQSKIMLREALSMDIEPKYRMWSTPGLHVNFEGVPENATHIQTTVIKSPKGKFGVAVELVAKKETKPDVEKVVKFFPPLDGTPKPYMKIVAKFTSLEELKDKFPQLLELEGSLLAF